MGSRLFYPGVAGEGVEGLFRDFCGALLLGTWSGFLVVHVLDEYQRYGGLRLSFWWQVRIPPREVEAIRVECQFRMPGSSSACTGSFWG